MALRKALFLDRDGVINVDYGYVHRKQDCVFVDGIFELVRAANKAGYAVVIVTNQAGIARGYFTVEQFDAFTAWMLDRFVVSGAQINRLYYCPHHPEHGSGEYRVACGCRKPMPGLFERARDELDLDMTASLLIGDKASDLEAAKRAGVARRFLFGGAFAEREHVVKRGLGEPVERLAQVRSLIESDALAAKQASLT